MVSARRSVAGVHQKSVGLAMLLFVGAGMPGACRARPKDGTGGTALAQEVAPPVLTLTLQAVQSTYHLPDGAAVKRQIEAAERSDAAESRRASAPAPHVDYPKPPAVDLLLTITNPSKTRLQMTGPGDDQAPMTLFLDGPGAVRVAPLRGMTGLLNLITRTLVLGPGESYSYRFERLASGDRGYSELSYWTLPGEYRMVVQWRPGTAPRLDSDPDERDLLAIMTHRTPWTWSKLTSNMVTVRVMSP